VFDAMFELEGAVVPIGPDGVPGVDGLDGEEPLELEPEPEESEVEDEVEGLLPETEPWPPAPDVSEEPDWEPEEPEPDLLSLEAGLSKEPLSLLLELELDPVLVEPDPLESDPPTLPLPPLL
jgi:hypothetical protein